MRKPHAASAAMPKRDQRVVTGQRQPKKTPLHLVAADHLHLVQTVQQVSGVAEIDNRPAAIGRALPEPPFDAGVIGAETGIGEQHEGENDETGTEQAPGNALRGADRHKRRKRNGEVVGITLLKAERTGPNIEHQFEEPRAGDGRGANDRNTRTGNKYCVTRVVNVSRCRRGAV